MSRTLPLAAVQPKLSELVAGMVPGEEVVLTADGEPVANVIRPPRTSWPCQPGTPKDRSFWMAPDFDTLMEDYQEYMELRTLKVASIERHESERPGRSVQRTRPHRAGSN
jgi:antitoxin (DNA-binding transcriptional repressor) of toxin-antitoxin stability system